MDYIQNIRKKVGKDKIILNFTCGILNQSGKILLQKRADSDQPDSPGGGSKDQGKEHHPRRLCI